MSAPPMNINTTLATSLNDYYQNIPLTPLHQQHLHSSLPHNMHSQQISSTLNLPSMISLNNPVRIANVPALSIYDNSHQTQIINNSQTIYNSNIEMIPTNYNINQQNQQQIVIHSTPIVSVSNGAIHYMLESTSTHSNKYTSEKTLDLNKTASTSLVSTSTPSASIALLNSTTNDIRQAELDEILVQDPRLSSVNHSSILFHHRSNNFNNENLQYLMLNSHHLQSQQHIDEQILINDEHDFAVISSSSTQMSPIVTSVNSTITNTIDDGYHHNLLSTHHHSLGRIVYMEEEEELMDTENLSNSHQHHHHNHIINEQNDMDDLIGGEENLLNNEDHSSNDTLKFMHKKSMISIVNNTIEQNEISNNENKFLHRNPMIEMQTSSFKNVHNNEISINKNEKNDIIQHQTQSVIKDRNENVSNELNNSLQQNTNNDILDKETKL